MRRIAIIAPCILPVPATKGGAVEELITRILRDNEVHKKLKIDLFTIEDNAAEKVFFEYTNIISVSYKKISQMCDSFSDKIYRRIPNGKSRRLLDKDIVMRFSEALQSLEQPYDAVIIENQASTAMAIMYYCKGKYEIPLYFHMHNDVDVYRSKQDISELVRNGVQFIAVSDYIKESILCQDKGAVVHVLYNGIDFERYERKENAYRNGRRFLYAGRIIPGKGVKELVVAFNRFVDSLEKTDNSKDIKRCLGTNYTLDIIGFSENHSSYEKEIIRLSKEHKDLIRCYSRISTDAMAQKYQEYDVVVMPTIDEEPFGLVALETIARGMPLITTNSGALPEVVNDGALLVDKNEDFNDNLFGAIRKMAYDKEFREDLSERAYLAARRKPEFDIKNYYDNFFSILFACKYDEIISVIIPVYNVEKYLPRCVESIVNQTYRRLDIILVDDGSTDNSGKMCDDYAHKGTQIRVIHQKNTGLAGARNTGLDNATGDYIFFCDSDDLLQEDALGNMLAKLKLFHADVVACGFSHVDDVFFERKGQEKRFTSEEPCALSGHESVIQMMRSNSVCTTACNKLYKRKLFDDVRFPEGYYHEDEASTYKLLYKSKMVAYTPSMYYKYYQREDSYMRNSMENRYQDFLEALSDRREFFLERRERELYEHSQISYLDGIKYAYRCISDYETRKKLAELYADNISVANAPLVMGMWKAFALLLWKYLKY